MKTPTQISQQLSKDWHNSAKREARVLGQQCWPLDMPIGRPSAKMMREQFDAVRQHVDAWREQQRQSSGEVIWAQHRYRDVAGTVNYPSYWRFHDVDEWVRACDEAQVRQQWQLYQRVLANCEERYHALLLRQRALVVAHSADEIIRLCALAAELTPACARGAPLRSLAFEAIDSKFIERHRALLIKLLDVRYDGAVSEQGLERFLHASKDNIHWLLVLDLDGQLLPYRQMRLADETLKNQGLPGSHLLVVENEQCAHLLPALKQTVAVLGGGRNVAWLASKVWAGKSIAYWGDIDTWGLAILAQVRRHQAKVSPILMDKAVFQAYQANTSVEAVRHPFIAQGLSATEQALYHYLLAHDKGRLEQEYLAREQVENCLRAWRGLAL